MKRDEQTRLLKHLIHQLDTGTNLDAGLMLRAHHYHNTYNKVLGLPPPEPIEG